ncbi:hypothetical protein HDU83_002671 [Entophlyctis luteolus]|nr:hypothetical protein HDU83_002671 [Entophlyctis luteolus]
MGTIKDDAKDKSAAAPVAVDRDAPPVDGPVDATASGEVSRSDAKINDASPTESKATDHPVDEKSKEKILSQESESSTPQLDPSSVPVPSSVTDSSSTSNVAEPKASTPPPPEPRQETAPLTPNTPTWQSSYISTPPRQTQTFYRAETPDDLADELSSLSLSPSSYLRAADGTPIARGSGFRGDVGQEIYVSAKGRQYDTTRRPPQPCFTCERHPERDPWHWRKDCPYGRRY